MIYESTVYPGLTEIECREVLEKTSGLKYQEDFHLGYSPERVNPGDRTHTIDKVVKIVSGSSEKVLDIVDELYCSIVTAGTHRAPTIATAEAAKVIENTQRDLNIALVNELGQIFDRIGLDTRQVLNAASTKWNFLDFQPGLVGGHCIGVDPYYLTHLAEKVGYHSQVVLAGRRINDTMGHFIAQRAVKLVAKHGTSKLPLNIGVLGMTFKENVPDLRNTRSVDVVVGLEEFGAKVHCVDPVCDAAQFEAEFGRLPGSLGRPPPL